ncbi:MAG: T9SS type A sorting domain-containing protein [Dysgonamonadaceae bacterium]|jgi:hypothetical protein|nr:T9SS type A sorting domain-containing protein [Dysgonamonadaceae bacterium]
MKKIITCMMVCFLAAFAGNKVQAQEFDFDQATNFHLIWLDEGSEQYWEITPRIEQDLRLNGSYGAGPGGTNVGERFMDIWSDTYYAGEASGKGSLDQIGNYLYFIANAIGWGGGGFQLIPQAESNTLVDFTSINSNYRFHMAIKKTNPAACRINLYGGGKPDDNNPAGPYVADDGKRAQFVVGTGDHVYNDPALPNLTPNFVANTWQIIDIPVSQLQDMGWNNRSAFKGYFFSYEFGSVAGNDLAIDAVFYYALESDGINSPNAGSKQLQVVVTKNIVEVMGATAPIEVYNLTGSLVKTSESNVFGTEELNKGAYIVKSGNSAAKVIIR